MLALTPQSGNFSYCTPAQLAQRFDVRTLGDWLGDQGLRLDPTAVAASPTLNALLQTASGELESRCMRGQRYQPTDLQTLAAQTTTNGAALLADIVAGWCVYLIWRRRVRQYAEVELPVAAQQAAEAMAALQEGETVLPFTEAAEAGKMRFKVENARIVAQRRGCVTIAGRYFGTRGSWYGEGGDQGN